METLVRCKSSLMGASSQSSEDENAKRNTDDKEQNQEVSAGIKDFTS